MHNLVSWIFTKINSFLYWAELVLIFNFSGGSMVKNLPAMWETQVRSLGWEDPLKRRMATHSSILTWRIPWTEEPGAQQATIHGFWRVKHNWVTNTDTHTVIVFKNAGSQVLNSLEISIELLLWFLILYFCYEIFFFCSITKLSLTFCNPFSYSMPGFHILHYLPEPAQIHVH